MFYTALCLDNTHYFETGTITVRIFEYYNRPRLYRDKDGNVISSRIDDLSSDESLLTEADKFVKEPTTKVSGDFEAILFAPFGGGRNYGSFVMPQINEKGIVTFLDGAFSKPLWMGSYFDAVRNPEKYGEVQGVNIPNDDPSKDGIEDGAVDRESNLLDSENEKPSIIMRTKHTVSDSVDNMNWKEKKYTPTENLVVMNDKKLRAKHFSEWDSDGIPTKHQEVMIFEDGDKETIKLEVTNSGDSKQGILKLTEDGFNITLLQDGDSVSSFTLSEAGNSINFADQHGNIIYGDENGLSLTTDENNAVLINGDEDTMVLYTDLKTILEDLMEHIHIGAVPTKGPLKPNKADLNYKKQLTDMEANMVKSRHK
jgi:hypothetical protein